ncbi:hypothetical protein PS037_23715 (plasmid) [Escherichia albertii]|uniref:hypothetical protein n=1 Tax=Escherichia albertii TaxID=208962 RepID=UPI0023616476|nr:hypothetical protein [Escherichia albertii]WDB54719.1 hypothetical protein PS037_23715 [Escherichia albertii]
MVTVLITVVLLLFMAFPGVPLAGRAVVNGASEAVSALTPNPGLAATVPVAPWPALQASQQKAAGV